MKMKRIMSSLIGFPLVFIILVFANSYIIDIIFSLVSIIAIREYFNSFSKKAKPIKWIRIYFLFANSFYAYYTS